MPQIKREGFSKEFGNHFILYTSSTVSLSLQTAFVSLTFHNNLYSNKNRI